MSHSKFSKTKVTIPKLPNVEQIDFSLLEKKSSTGNIDQYFSKAELTTLSNYERLRYQNMKKNYEMMIALGLPAIMPEFMKGPRARKRKIKKEEPEDSDEEWTPDLERRKSNRAQKQTVPFAIPFKEKERKKKQIKDCGETNKIFPKKERSTATKNEEKREYPLRKLPRTNYMALEVPDDDEYLYCEDCNKEYKGECPVHGELIVVEDSEVPASIINTSDQAIFTLPDGLTVKESSIEGAGLGVFAEKDISVRTRFGPYRGKMVTDVDSAHSSGYAWQVYKDGKPSHFVDAVEKSSSNWMRYVNCARTESEQNLAAYQYKGEIYYRTYKAISVGSELLVWYGQDYGQDLGICRTDHDHPWIQPKVINGEVIYPCIWCKGKAYNSVEYLRKHVGRMHGALLQSTEACHLNRLNSKTVPNMVMKLKQSNRGSCYDFNIQKQEQNTRLDLDERLHFCPCCRKSFTLKSDFDDHMRMVHVDQTPEITKPLKQDSIKIVGGFDKENDKGVEYVKQNRPVSKGSNWIQGNESIMINKTQKTLNAGDKYTCDVCSKQFANSHNLKIHYRTHTEDLPNRCDICGKGFVREDKLKEHYSTHTGDKPYKCDVCAKSFTVQRNLQRHYRTHTGDLPYKCDVCGKGYTQLDNLQYHHKTHTGDKPFKCDVCGKGFVREDQLQMHHRTHSGDKPYKCDVCGKGFTVSGNLQRHHRTHTGDKPYKCDVCGKGFTVPGNLKTHHRTHTGDKPYKCDVCGKGYKQHSGLQYHKRTHT